MKKLALALLFFGASLQADVWTFRSIPNRIYPTGLIPHFTPRPEPMGGLDAGEEYPKSFHLSSVAALSPVMNQGSCGSCVYNSVVKNLEDSLLLRAVATPRLSRQFLMDCGSGWSCNGSYFTKVAGSLQSLGGTPLESDYPYKARNQSCRGGAPLAASITSYKVIQSNPKTIVQALLAGYPVSVTVAADRNWMSYGGGVYNACLGTAINHEVLIEGYDCEDAVDADGHCAFDANGRLPAGKGVWYVTNSWGTGWGEQGTMRSKMTARTGRKCNQLATEAGILEVVK